MPWTRPLRSGPTNESWITYEGCRKEFVEEAPIHEYGIVSLEALSVIDMIPSFAANPTARLISQGISTYRLWSKGAKFLLALRDDGKHVLSVLE